jgi:dihydrodipicolinate synthase/N-acetylneuraminate lyase
VWEAQPGAELRFRKALLKERGAVAGDHCRAPLPPAPDARTQAVEVLASLRELVA